MTREKEMEDRFIATMLGTALGDTLGMPVEGFKKEQIKKYAGRITEPISPVIVYGSTEHPLGKDEFGPLKYYTKDLQRGQYTDDTILTKALAESLIAEKGFNVFDIAKRQVAEYTKRVQPDGTVFGGFGKTTTDAFKRLLTGISPLESGVIGGPGNAPAMKMAPLGLYMAACDEYGDVHRLGLYWAELVGKITHLDARSVVSGVVQAQAIYAMARDFSREEFLDSVVVVSSSYEQPVSVLSPLWQKGSLMEKLQWVKDNKDVSAEEAHKVLGSNSNVFCSYPFALFMVQHYWDSPLEGLIETVNYGGDCDTTGAIYGALVGAKNGMKIFPEKWLNVLEGKEELEELGRKLYQLRGKV